MVIKSNPIPPPTHTQKQLRKGGNVDGKAEGGNSNFMGVVRQGKLRFDLYGTEKNYVLAFYSLYST